MTNKLVSILLIVLTLVSVIEISLSEPTLLSDSALIENVLSRSLDLPLNEDQTQHLGRHLLNASPKADNSSDPFRYLTVVGDSCLFYYATSVSVSIGKSNATVVFDNTPVADGSQCWSVNATQRTQTEPAILQLYYGNETVSLNVSLTINSPFGYNQSNGWWAASEGSAQYKNDGNEMDYFLNVKAINSETKFSYSCSKFVMKSYNNSFDNGTTQLILTFTRFQLQPFASTAGVNNTIFNDSFDCETWMTLPLWMGLITLFVYFAILYIGIYFLLQINTNDRFENPKGKPLIISNIDE